MKKSLLALAVLGAFAGVASAQSSVTLFGVIDVNARFVNNGGVKQYQMNQDGIASSRLGFRGTEDLGGGLAASFWLEGALNPQTGTSGGQSWQRRSTVSLSGGWGEARLGRDYTATFWNATIFDPFGTNGLGASSNIYLTGFAKNANNGTSGLPTGAAYATLVRDNNIFAYFLPSGIAGGLYGQLQYAPGEGAPGQKYLGGRLGYAAGPFNVAAAWAQTQVTIQPVAGLPGDEKLTNYNFGGSWDFKFLLLSAYYGRLELSQAAQNNWYIGAVAPMGLWNFKGSYGQVDRSGHLSTTVPTSVDGQKAYQFALGADYNLSKRTALYGTYAYINNKGGAGFTVGNTLNDPPGFGSVANGNSQGLEFGIRHSF